MMHPQLNSFWWLAEEQGAQRPHKTPAIRCAPACLCAFVLMCALCACGAPSRQLTPSQPAAAAQTGSQASEDSPTEAQSSTAAQPANAALPPRLVTVEVPVTVEVTRETVTERIVPATPLPPTPCAPASLEAAEEVVVGVLMPLSQSSSLAATLSAQSALVLANANLNDAGGVRNTPVELWWGDTANLPAQGAQRAEEAILQHCAVALIGGNNSDTAAAIDVVAQRYGVPHVIIEGADNALTASQSRTLFRLAPNNAMVTDLYVSWLSAVGDYNGDGVVAAAIIAENMPYQLAIAEMMRQSFAEAEIATDVYPVEGAAGDFSSLVARIVVKDTLPDALFVRVNSETGTLLLQQLLENGVGPTRKTLLVAPRMPQEGSDHWRLAGEKGEWLVAPRVGAWQGMTGDAAAPLLDGYARLFARWPDSAAFSANDALLLLADAMRRAPSLASDDLLRALETTDIALAGGQYTFPINAATRSRSDAPAWAWHQWLDLPLLLLQRTATGTEIIWPPHLATVAGGYLRSGQ